MRADTYALMETTQVKGAAAPFAVRETVAPVMPTIAEAQANPVTVVAVEPPKPSKLAEGWKSFSEGPFARTADQWFGGIVKGIPLVAPIALTAGAGYALGGINAYEASAGFGLVLGGVAGAIGIPFQLDLIPGHEKAGSKFPRLAAFRDVTLYMTAPAATIGTGIALAANGGWGVAAAVVTGIIGAIFGMQVHDTRVADNEARAKAPQNRHEDN